MQNRQFTIVIPYSIIYISSRSLRSNHRSRIYSSFGTLSHFLPRHKHFIINPSHKPISIDPYSPAVGAHPTCWMMVPLAAGRHTLQYIRCVRDRYSLILHANQKRARYNIESRSVVVRRWVNKLYVRYASCRTYSMLYGKNSNNNLMLLQDVCAAQKSVTHVTCVQAWKQRFIILILIERARAVGVP